MKYEKEMDNLFNEVLVDLKDESKFKPVTEKRTWAGRKRLRLSASYLIVHFKSGKAYVGSTSDIEQRLYDHVLTLIRDNHKNKNLQNAFNEDNRLKFYIVVTETAEEALECEQYLLTLFSSKQMAFNVGTNAKFPSLGITRPEESNLRLGRRQVKYWKQNLDKKKDFVALMQSDEVKQKRLNTLNIPEIKDKQLTNLRAAVQSQENRLRSTKENNRRWSDPEFREKTKKAIQLANQDPERRAKIVEANRRRWADPEYKKRVSEAISRARLAKRAIKDN